MRVLVLCRDTEVALLGQARHRQAGEQNIWPQRIEAAKVHSGSRGTLRAHDSGGALERAVWPSCVRLYEESIGMHLSPSAVSLSTMHISPWQTGHSHVAGARTVAGFGASGKVASS